MKKRFWIRVLSIVLTLFLISCTLFIVGSDRVTAAQDGDYTYLPQGYGAVIIGYTGTDTVISIPATLGGLAVEEIGDSAFKFCTSLTSVTIPNSVTAIMSDAFHSCTSLTSLTIGSSVSYIGTWAFNNCSSLTSVTIPNSVTTIGYQAFSGCTSLSSITIGKGVTDIGQQAFQYCTSLTSITFLGLVAPNVGSDWIMVTPDSIRGHAYAESDFPLPDHSFFGLIMGSQISSSSDYMVLILAAAIIALAILVIVVLIIRKGRKTTVIAPTPPLPDIPVDKPLITLCGNCKKEIPVDSILCPYCGTKVRR